MTWFKVDDQWHDHPKCLGLSFAAKGLWAHAGSWCAAKLTDGFVPRGALKIWGAAPALAAELVSHGLWHATEVGWQFHEWTEYQPSKAAIVKKRGKIRERVAKHRSGNAVTGELHESDSGPCNAVTEVTVTLPPSRPVPSRPVERENARDPESPPDPPRSLEFELTAGFAKRLEKAAAAIPNQRSLGAAVRDLAPWIRETAPLRKLSETELATRVLDGFFANDNARAKRFPPSYLAQNPLEYLDPLKPQLRAAPKIPDGIPPIQHFGPREETG